jgi:hypothetical protein
MKIDVVDESWMNEVDSRGWWMEGKKKTKPGGGMGFINVVAPAG